MIRSAARQVLSRGGSALALVIRSNRGPGSYHLLLNHPPPFFPISARFASVAFDSDIRAPKSSTPVILGDQDGDESDGSHAKLLGHCAQQVEARGWKTMAMALLHNAYSADMSIDLKKHHNPDTAIDKMAYYTVKALRWPTDVFFQKRYGCRAMMLETVAAVPGMVGGMLLHCKSLRRFEHSGGWIKTLIEEAENERMHLMTFMEVAKPRWYERMLVFTVQGVFFNAYFLLYLISPRLCHRITGYLEEEAIYSYTHFLEEIEKGNIPNVPAPAIAVDYWRLNKDATIKDVVMVVRADEAHHRDVNHFAADIHESGMELRQAPAPIGYH